MHLFKRIMNDIRWAFNTAEWIPESKDWIFANSCISQEEKNRVHQFHFKNDAKLALAGRLLIRSCISYLTEIPPSDILLERTQKSKPFLVNNMAGLSFNVSHQGNYSVIAGSLLNEVGVDVMKIDRPVNTTVPNFFKTMTRQFTPDEWEVIKSKASEREQMKAFYRFWCLKESYVKAIGTGLGTSTAEYMRFELNTESLSDEEVVEDSTLYVHGERVDWTFHEHLIDNEHIVTVATKPNHRSTNQPPKTVPFVNITYDEVIKHVAPIIPTDSETWTNFSSKKEKPVKVFDSA